VPWWRWNALAHERQVDAKQKDWLRKKGLQ
jgi:hypothetical protein